MEKLKVVIENKQKKAKLPTGLRLLIRRCCHAALQLEGFQGSAEIGVTIVDDDQIRQINKEHRNIDSTTDVLSFPMGENGEYDKNPETGGYILGDIVLSIERAMEQADRFGHSLQREVGYLIVHSVLHLLDTTMLTADLRRCVCVNAKKPSCSRWASARSSYVLADEDTNLYESVDKELYVCRARIWFCIRHERNFQIHIVASIYVLWFGFWFSLGRAEWQSCC